MRIRKTLRKSSRNCTTTIVSGRFEAGIEHLPKNKFGLTLRLGKKGRGIYELLFGEEETFLLLEKCIWHLKTVREKAGEKK